MGTESLWFVAALWIGLALMASLLSIRFGLSVALVEIVVGTAAGNLLDLRAAPPVDFLAAVGSVLLTFLAGAELDLNTMRTKWRETLGIGLASFLAPFLGAIAFASGIAGWSLPAAEIAGIALSTTSVAVVYAVMLERGYNRTDLGKIILAACFVTDLGTVAALGLLFASYDWWLLAFVLALSLLLWQFPLLARRLFASAGGRLSEPELKLILVVLCGMGILASLAKSEAVLPAYLLGMALAPLCADFPSVIHRIRVATFSLLTPFYFLKAGTLVDFHAILTAWVLIALLLGVKITAKFAGVWPLVHAFRFGRREGLYTTLLMSTGLTFGTISSLFGLTHGIIDQRQYTVLVTVVILSAIVPTLIAERWFDPGLVPAEASSFDTQPATPAQPMTGSALNVR